MLPTKESGPRRRISPPPRPRRMLPDRPLREEGSARQPFRRLLTLRGLCPAPPVALEERDATALPRLRPASAGFYSGHTPPLRGFNHPGINARAPGTNPAPAEVPALAMASIRPITSVAGVTRRSCHRTSEASAPAQLPCPRWTRFREGETRSSSLPIDNRHSQFGIVFGRTHRQALDAMTARASRG